eukprot:SAG22_NODE_6949_length_791_cov_8.468208_1_plen_189_part_01
MRVAIEAARGTLNTADTAIAGASDRFNHNGHTVATNTLATGDSFTYNFSLISAILNQPKYFPLIFTNLGLDIYLHLEDGVNIGVYDNAIAGDDGGYRIDNVKFHCHLVDVDKTFYDRMRQSISDRMWKHSSSSMDPKANGYNCALYKHMREVGQFELSLELLEAYPCNTKKEMVQREQFWMDQYDWEIL